MANGQEKPKTAKRVKSARWNVITRLDWWFAFAIAFLFAGGYFFLAPMPEPSKFWSPESAYGIQTRTAGGLGIVGFFGYFLILRWLLLWLVPGWFTTEFCGNCGTTLRATHQNCPCCGSVLLTDEQATPENP
jgi:hypothetical protein